MSPDLRYHVATLTAVFLALGIGILIGTAFVGAPVVQRQTSLIHLLEQNVGALRRETQEQAGAEDALRSLRARLVNGELTGRRVLVIQSGPYADAAADTTKVLTEAGALVTSVTLPLDGWKRKLSELESTPDAMESEAGRLAPLLAGSATEALASYRDNGLLNGPNDDNAGAARAIVLIGGGQNTAPVKPGITPTEDAATLTLVQSRDLPLLEKFKSLNLTVVAVEPFAADFSRMRLYQSMNIATVDNIDRAAGQIALVYALKGETARYGYKETAERVLPASLANVPEVPDLLRVP